MLQALVLLMPPLLMISVLWFLERHEEPDSSGRESVQSRKCNRRQRSQARRR